MAKKMFFLAGTLFLFLWTIEAHALNLTLNSAERGLFAQAQTGSSIDTASHVNNLTGLYGNSVIATACEQIYDILACINAQATQNTDLVVLADSLDVSGNLFAMGGTSSGILGPGPSMEARSYLHLFFSIDASAQYAHNIGLPHLGFGTLYLTNLDTSTSVFGDAGWLGSGAYTGNMASGNYEYFFEVSDWAADFWDWSDVNVSFAVGAPQASPIPEPSTILLLGGAMAGLVVTRIRRFWKR